MVQLVRGTKVKVIPKEGELEVTLNININIDGEVTASSDEAHVRTIKKEPEKEEEVERLIPNFTSGVKLNFGKEE